MRWPHMPALASSLTLVILVSTHSAFGETHNRLLKASNGPTGTNVSLVVSADSLAEGESLDLSCRVLISSGGVPVDTVEVDTIVTVAAGCIGSACCNSSCGDTGCQALGAGLSCFTLKLGPVGQTTEYCICGTIKTVGTVAQGQTLGFAIEPLAGAVAETNLSDDVLMVTGSTVGVEPIAGPSPLLRLEYPLPNPTSGGFHVAFVVPAAGFVKMDLLDISGRRVARILNAYHAAGRHVFEFTSLPNGNRIGKGTYFLRLSTGTASSTQRLTVIQ